MKRKPSPTPPDGTTPKKAAGQPTGLFQGQNPVLPPPPPPISPAESTSAEDLPKTPRIPAIFIDGAVDDWATHAEKLDSLIEGEFEASFRGTNYRIQTRSLADFRAVQKYCCSRSVPMHTFSLGRQRNLKVVISGLPTNTTADSLTIQLEALNFEALDAVRLRTRRGPTRSWLVSFNSDVERDPDSRRAADIYGITAISYVRVRITPYRRPAGPPQCHRCQGFGHGSINCWRPQKCVRCRGSHLTAACTKEKGERGECCNCGGQHNANYRGCPTYKAAKTGLRPRPPGRTPRPPPTEAQPTPPEQTTDSAPDQTDEATDTEPPRPKKRRKRPPRNPANRRSQEDAPPQREQRPTPRRRIDWPPKPAAAPTARQAPAAGLSPDRKSVV